MRSSPHLTAGINPGPLDPGIAARTAAAASLGLSSWEQVTRCKFPAKDQARRLRRMRRVVLGAAGEINEHLQRERQRFRAAMITLTYRPDQDWQPRQISRLMQCIRDWLGRRGHKMRAVWVLELTKAGRPHYHAVVWLPRGLTLPKPDKQGWWQCGSTRIEWARRPVGYLAKYTSKGDDQGHAMPKGARVCGVYGCPVHLGWWRAPGWLRAIAEPRNVIQRMPGGWWAVPRFAHAWRSPWRVIHVGEGSVEVEWVGWSSQDVVPLWNLERGLATC